jgi:hypothetical protein
MRNGDIPFRSGSGPREVLHAIRQALSDDSSLKRGVPAEEIARQLITRGYLQEEPSLALVEEMLEVLEEGGLGLRNPTLQPCALEYFWDSEAGRLHRNIDLSMAVDWIGAPATWWDRKMPQKLTHAKTPPCTDLISEPAEVLRNRDRWPIHICEEEFTRQSTELWSEAQSFRVDSVNIHRWAAMFPLPIGRRALMIHPDVKDLSEWSEVFDVLPFEEYERAVWALRVEHRTFPTVHTLDLFGLAEYSTENVAGPLAFSVRGKSRFLIDVLYAADRWWAQFKGLTLRGRPKGTGTWASPEHFQDDLDQTLAEMRSREEKITQESVSEHLGIHKKTLVRWLQICGRNWSEIQKI